MSGFIEECLENIRIAMTCLNGEELPGAGADGSNDVQPDMIAIMDYSGLRSFHGPTPTWSRFTVNSGFIP